MVAMKKYVIDFEKVKTVEDVARILKSLHITFTGEYEGMEGIKDLLIEVDYEKQDRDSSTSN